MRKYYNKSNYKDPVTIEYNSNYYCQTAPNFNVWVLNKQGETLYSSQIHERALHKFISDLKNEFNVVND